MVVLLVLVASAATAQGAPRSQRWGITVAWEGTRFGSTARDTAGPEAGEVDLRPTGRGGVRISVDRVAGPWRLTLEAGWAEGNAEAANGVVLIRDKTLELSRYRLASGLERRLTALGAGDIAAGVAPTLDLWTAGSNEHARWGLELRLTARVPVGRLDLENRLAIGLSGSPLDEEDLEEEFQRRSLRSLSLGVGLRVPL